MKACVQLLSNQWHISAEETAFEDHPLLEHAIALHKRQEVVGVYGEVKPAIRDVRHSLSGLFLPDLLDQMAGWPQ